MGLKTKQNSQESENQALPFKVAIVSLASGGRMGGRVRNTNTVPARPFRAPAFVVPTRVSAPVDAFARWSDMVDWQRNPNTMFDYTGSTAPPSREIADYTPTTIRHITLQEPNLPVKYSTTTESKTTRDFSPSIELNMEAPSTSRSSRSSTTTTPSRREEPFISGSDGGDLYSSYTYGGTYHAPRTK